MKSSGYVFMMMMILSIPLSGQIQYASALRSGEGRANRVEQSAILINPVFVQPGVFFSGSKIETQTSRKWWRNSVRALPQPYTPGQVPANILEMDKLKIENFQRQQYVQQLIMNPELHAQKVSFALVSTPARLLD